MRPVQALIEPAGRARYFARAMPKECPSCSALHGCWLRRVSERFLWCHTVRELSTALLMDACPAMLVHLCQQSYPK